MQLLARPGLSWVPFWRDYNDLMYERTTDDDNTASGHDRQFYVNHEAEYVSHELQLFRDLNERVSFTSGPFLYDSTIDQRYDSWPARIPSMSSPPVGRRRPRARHRIDLRATWSSFNDRWRVTGFVNNVTDEIGIRQILRDGADNGYRRTAQVSEPRVYGMEVSYSLR